LYHGESFRERDGEIGDNNAGDVKMEEVTDLLTHGARDE